MNTTTSSLEQRPSLLRKGSFIQQLKSNPTGAGYFSCNIAWFITGYQTTGLKDIDLYAGLTNLVGSTARLMINPEYEFMGWKNWDRRLGSFAGFASTAISTSPTAAKSFATGDIITGSAIILNDAVIAVAQYVDFNSGYFKDKDRTHDPLWKRVLLSKPSVTAGAGRALSRVLPITINIMYGNIPMALVFAALGAVDLYYMTTNAVKEFKTAKADTQRSVAVAQAPAFFTPSAEEVMARVNSRTPDRTTAEVMAVIDAALAAYRKRGTFSQNRRVRATPLQPRPRPIRTGTARDAKRQPAIRYKVITA